MMFSSQFDGNSFVSSQSSQQTDSGPSPSRNREALGIIPVTVKQISQASISSGDKANFVIEGVDIHNVSLVGIISNKVERAIDIAFALDDGTGRVECIRWTNEPFDSKEMKDIEDGMYVHVNGRLRIFQGKMQLVAFSTRPVTNFDEISYHFIHCIHFHLQNSKVKQGDFSTPPQMTNPSLNLSSQNGTNVHHHVQPINLSEQFNVDGLKGFDKMVLDYLQQPSNFEREKGVHTDELAQKLKIPMQKIMESIRTLEEEGLIYSTIDEFHYKATSSS